MRYIIRDTGGYSRDLRVDCTSEVIQEIIDAFNCMSGSVSYFEAVEVEK